MKKHKWYAISIFVIFLLLSILIAACAKPAQFLVISLDINPTEVTEGETVNFVAQIKNIGGSKGIYTAILTIDGEEMERKDISVAPDAVEKAAFLSVVEKRGTYKVTIGEQSSSFMVKPKGLSFEAAHYRNGDYGFSIKYPASWKEVSGQGWPEAIFYAAAPAQVPVLAIILKPIEDGHDTLANVLTTIAEKSGSSAFQVVSESDITLPDSRPGYEAVIKWEVQKAPGETFAVGVKDKGNWVIATVTTVPIIAPYDGPLFAEIAHTLQLGAPISATIRVEPPELHCSANWAQLSDIAIRLSGSGWIPGEVISIELVSPSDVDSPGWIPGEKNVSIGLSMVNADGNFKIEMDDLTKLITLLGLEYEPGFGNKIKRVRPVPPGLYTILASGYDPNTNTTTVATKNWKLNIQ